MFNDFSNDSQGYPQGVGETNTQTPSISGKARIKVIGVGGAGNNAVNRMIESGITGAKFYVVNTDSQILALSLCENRIQIGTNLTNGLGAGADPEVGRAAAEESKDKLTQIIKDTDLLFITAGMGGGTGTGAAPIIAKIARDMRILTVAVVTEPFEFEGQVRIKNTAKGLSNLKRYVDTLIVIPNDKLKTIIPKNTPFKEALIVADEILKQGIRGLTELIVNPALINLDFADVKTILKDKGIAHLGVGVAKGENRILEAVRVAVNSPLLETTIEGAKGVILNVVGGQDLTFEEVVNAASMVRSVVDASANIIFGARIDPNVQDEVEITIIATSFPGYDSASGEGSQSQTYVGGFGGLSANNGMYQGSQISQNQQILDPYRRQQFQSQPVQPISRQGDYAYQPTPNYQSQQPQYVQPQQPQPVQSQPVQPVQSVQPTPPVVNTKSAYEAEIERPNNKTLPAFVQRLKGVFGKDKPIDNEFNNNDKR